MLSERKNSIDKRNQLNDKRTSTSDEDTPSIILSGSRTPSLRGKNLGTSTSGSSFNFTKESTNDEPSPDRVGLKSSISQSQTTTSKQTKEEDPRKQISSSLTMSMNSKSPTSNPSIPQVGATKATGKTKEEKRRTVILYSQQKSSLASAFGTTVTVLPFLSNLREHSLQLLA